MRPIKNHLVLGMLLVALGSLSAACGNGQSTEVDADAACDRLEELGHAILDVREASSLEEVGEGVERALDAFTTAAESSGDDRLEELADTARDRFDVFLTGDGIDAREAGTDVDIALDRSIERCVELGARNDFPQEP